MKRSFYAVARGKNPGVYKTWPECEKQVKGYTNARYKKFENEADALAFIDRYKDIGKKKVLCVVYYIYSVSGVIKNASVERWVAEGVPVVYTDGSCFGNGMAGCKAGYGVFWGDNHPDNLSEPLDRGPPTNNRAELTAVIRALEQAEKRGYKRLVVRTDSNLLIQSMSVWIHSWRRNNWKTASGTDVQVCITFSRISGHVGVYGNEKADELARSGAERYSSHRCDAKTRF
ncbi:unnamed protein product [Enterobius vermicularis]|uniref:Ribonuclease H n=1 Tax=Enterobius vermicularis TaxID=51028 RepID=A0A0N4V537_ENTVE|nr:unnamed protein product [Enterobius vermicularis]